VRRRLRLQIKLLIDGISEHAKSMNEYISNYAKFMKEKLDYAKSMNEKLSRENEKGNEKGEE